MTTHDDSNGFPFGPGFPVSSITMQWGGSPTSPSAGSGTVAPGGKADSASIPFAEFAAQWMRQMTPGWSRLTRTGTEDILRAHLRPAFGLMPLHDITRQRVLDFRSALAEKPGLRGNTLKPGRINKVMVILSQIMGEAHLRFGIPDPTVGIKAIKDFGEQPMPFSLEEVQRLLTGIRPDFEPYLATRFFTGLRTGEIDGLLWSNVDFEAGLILVRETYSAGKQESRAKTRLSIRDVPMLPMVRDALLRQQARAIPGCPYVFHSVQGRPMDAHNFTNRTWNPLLRMLGIAPRRPYHTRHTAATLFLAAGEAPEWIARVMGHANTQMLFTVYSRYVPNLTRRDGAAVAALLASRLPSAGEL